MRQASPDKSCPELRMRIGPLPPTPGQSSAASTGSSTSYWQQSSSPGSTGTSTTEATSPPPVAPPRVESLAFSGLITGSEAAPPLPARNPDPAPAPPPRNPAGLPPVCGSSGGGLPPPTPPAKLPRPVSHESLTLRRPRHPGIQPDCRQWAAGASHHPHHQPSCRVQSLTRASTALLAAVVMGTSGGAATRRPNPTAPVVEPRSRPPHLRLWTCQLAASMYHTQEHVLVLLALNRPWVSSRVAVEDS